MAVSYFAKTLPKPSERVATNGLALALKVPALLAPRSSATRILPHSVVGISWFS
jgi:hypothetical protein